MRKISYFLTLCMFITTLAPLTAVAYNDSTIKISINGEYVEFNDDLGYPFIDINNRTLVPFRATLETFGAEVSWNSVNRHAVAKKNDMVVSVPIGEKYILKDGVIIQNDTEAVVVNGRTYLPIRAVMEAFGAVVSWDGANRAVLIDSSEVEIEIIATKEDMKNGVIRVEFYEKYATEVTRSFSFGFEVQEEFKNQWAEPYIVDGEGTSQWEEGRLNYNITNDTKGIRYGYTLHPIRNNINSSFVTDDFSIFVMRNAIDIEFLHNLSNVYFSISVPSEMTLIAPWEPVAGMENTYLFESEQGASFAPAAVWGNFEEVRRQNIGEIEVVAFNYGCDESDNVDVFMDLTFDTAKIFLDVFEGFERTYFSPVLISGYVPQYLLYDEEHQYFPGMNYEGYRGAWIMEMNKDVTYEEFLESNVVIHGMTHWSVDDQIMAHWGIEGIANYYAFVYDYSNDKLNILYRQRIYDAVVYYNDVILANNLDIPLQIRRDSDYNSILERYNLKLTEDGAYVLNEGDDWQYIIEVGNGDGYTWNDSVQLLPDMSRDDMNWFVYDKSFLIFYMMDETIKYETSGEKSLIDALNSYYGKHVGYEQQSDVFFSTISEIIDQPLSTFVERFIEGTEPLPIKIVDGVITIDYELLYD